MVKDSEPDQLWDAYWADPSQENRNALATFYLPWVQSVSYSFTTPQWGICDQDDWLQEMHLAFLHIIETYQPKAGKFKSYARARLSFAWRDAARANDWVPRLDRDRAAKYNAALSECVQKGIEGPDRDALLAERFRNEKAPAECDRRGLKGKARKALLAERDADNLKRHHESKQGCEISHLYLFNQCEPRYGDGQPYKELTLMDMAAIDTKTPDPAERAAHNDRLHEFFRLVPERRARLTLKLYFFENLTMKEVAAVIGRSESWVSLTISSTGRHLQNYPQINEYLTA